MSDIPTIRNESGRRALRSRRCPEPCIGKCDPGQTRRWHLNRLPQAHRWLAAEECEQEGQP
jgi:hypothetical protein